MQLPLEKRKRAANFSEEEKLRFVRLLIEKGDVKVNKITSHDTRTNKMKEETWNLICRDHNSSGSIMRNTDTLKKLWQKLKSDAKTYSAAARQQVRGTGGGPCFKSCFPVLESVVEMTGRGSSGISVVSDCDSELIPVRQHVIIEAGPPSPPAAGPQDSLFETPNLLKTDIVEEEPSYSENVESITDVSADAVQLITKTPTLKRKEA